MSPSQKSNNDEEAIEFRGLEPLLRRGLHSNDLQVLGYTATKLLPLGENYCSVLVKIEAKIRRGRSAEETLHIAAKTANPTERPIVEWARVLPKEVFVYAELLPAYRQIEREAGVAESELCDVLPRYMGHRLSLDDRDESKIDDDGLLLMENIKAAGYYTCERRVGFDVHHARLALSSLARYHALGIAAKRKRPAFFERAIAQARVLGIDFAQIDEGFDAILENLRELGCFAKHLAVIEAGFERIKGGKLWRLMPEEPWATITHGDFWVNNMLFRKDAEGNVDAVKLVDFQTYLYASPLKDLPYFLTGSLDKDAADRHLGELLDLYYDSFVGTLRRLDCDAGPYTRRAFDEELRRQAINEFPLCALAQKFFMHDAKDEKDSGELMNTVFGSKCSDAYRDKLLKLVDVYERQGWF